MSLLLNAIIERKLLGINPQDKNNLSEYLEYAVDESKSTQGIVVPASWVNSTKHKCQLQELFNHYQLAALIDVGRIWSPVTAVPFTLIVLTKKANKTVLMAEFLADPVDHKCTGEVSKNGELPNLEYTEEFKQFLIQVEQALEQGLENSGSSTFFTVDFEHLDLSRLQVAFYHPDNQLDVERYKNAKFEPLENLAKIVNVRKLKDKGVSQVFTWSLVGKTEAGENPVKEADITSHQLAVGDIVITANLERAYVIQKGLADSYAPAHGFVLQASSNKITSEYLSLYLQSEIAKKYSLRVAVGAVLKRLTISDFKALPILIPNKQTLSKSAELCTQLQSPKPDIDIINQLIAAKEDKGSLQNSFLLEELDKLRISKRMMIERLIKEDLKELKVCIDMGLSKAAMVICGSVLEAVILDWLSETEKHDYYRDETKFSLIEALSLLKQLGEMDKESLDAAHHIRKMRNLIHPRNYLKNKGKVTKRECKKLLAELDVVIRAYKP